MFLNAFFNHLHKGEILFMNHLPTYHANVKILLMTMRSSLDDTRGIVYNFGDKIL
jgi:hypothetical protein